MKKKLALSVDAARRLFSASVLLLDHYTRINEETGKGFTTIDPFRLKLSQDQDVEVAIVSYQGRTKIHIGNNNYIQWMVSGEKPTNGNATGGIVIPATFLRDIDRRIGPVYIELL